MALSGEQWLQTHFFPIVNALPAPSDVTADPTSPTAALRIIATMRLLGGVDALVAVGALDAEQHERCRQALETKGATSKQWTVQSTSILSGFVAARASRGEAEPEPEPAAPDRLVRVLGDGHVFGLVEGEQAVLLAVEVWERTVRADVLVAVAPAAEERRAERARQMHEWLAKKRAGEATDADSPPMSSALTHPGAATTWLLEAGDTTSEGRVVAGQGGGEWWRLGIQWDAAVGDDAELAISAKEGGRVVGRSVLHR